VEQMINDYNIKRSNMSKLKKRSIDRNKISGLKDGAEFYLSPRKKVLYRLDTFEGSLAVITSLQSGLTFHKPKKTVCYF
jgi:hypothetical protein